MQRIHEAGFLSVIADKAIDSVNYEQLSISVQYFENGLKYKRFIAFCECQEAVSGDAIANAILDHLTE